MKYTNFFIFICLLSLILPVVALNETPVIEKVAMHIYGNAYYVNNLPLPAGTVIIAKDQFGSTIGKYTLRESGKIGREFGGVDDNFEIGIWKNQSDKLNRTMSIIIGFTINNVSTKNTLPFKQNDNLQFDIITPYLPPTPTQIPVQTTILSPVTTQTTSVVTNPTLVSSTSIITPNAENTQIILTSEQPSEPELTTNDYIYYGIIATIIIVITIAIIGVAIAYYMSRTSRDDCIGPDGKWTGK